MSRSDRPLPARPLIHAGVERRRVAAWLDSTQHVAVRIICGPIGSGKTVAVRQFVDDAGAGAAYLKVPAGVDAAALRLMLERADPDAVFVLDGIDRADPAAYAELVDAILVGEIPCRLVLVGRSRRRLRAETLLARGVGRICDLSALRFDADEVEALAGSYGFAWEREEIEQLVHETDGWPVAIAWLVRDAAEGCGTLPDTFTSWCERNGHLLLEYLERETAEDAAPFADFRRALTEGWGEGHYEAERLEQLGLPIVRTRAGLVPYRILTRLAVPADEGPALDDAAADLPPLMSLFAFGRFRCEIDGKAVAFSRRRDQQVFAYLALLPERRATREHLLEAFWPGVARSVSTQGLRTTLSRIRRAIAKSVPNVDPARYFRTAGEVRIDQRNVTVDVDRFIDHVEQGRLDDARGDVEGAKRHYRVARRVYADRLLASESRELCLERRAEQLEALYVEVLTRITELHAATGNFEIAREAARTLMACNTEDARRRALRGIATGRDGLIA